MKTLLLTLTLVLVPALVAADAAKDFPKPDAPPRAIKQEPPVYPRFALAAAVIGNVTLDFVVDREGNVESVHVAESNNPFFERPAMDAVLKWKFTPAMKAGKPVKTRARITIPFRLDLPPRLAKEPRPLWQIDPPRDWSKVPEALRWQVPPEPVRTLMAAYPFEAALAGKEGKATISYLIDRDGRVVAVKVREATEPEFGAAVVAMIDGWRFKAARKTDGSASYALVNLTREFRVDDRGDVPLSTSALWILGRLKKNKLVCARAEELDAPLKPLSQRPPIYPSVLREAGADGEATIEFYVDERGDAQLPRVVAATAPAFGYAAAQAVATWRFTVPKKDGKPVIARAQQQVKFNLKDRPAPLPAEFVP